VKLSKLFALTVLFAVFLCPARELDQGVIRGDNIFTARALAMGGAYSADADDYSALYFNPACLARVRSKDLHLSLGNTSLTNSSSNSLGMSGQSNVSEFKLNSLGMIYPFPTSQGSLVTALGYSRPMDFLDALSLHKNGAVIQDSRSDGHLSNFEAGLAIDLSPNVSVGGSGAIHSGFEDYVENAGTQTTSIKDSYFGATLDAGLQARFTGNIAAGANVRFVNYVTYDRESSLKSGDTLYLDPKTTTSLYLPVQVNGGIAYSTVPFTFAVDAGYANWTNLTFAVQDKAPVNYQSELKDTYRFSAGTEWLLPHSPVKLRLGVRYETHPFASEEVKDPLTYSGGLGILLDKTLAVDLAGSVGRPVVTDSAPKMYELTQDYSIYRVLVTLSYRY
jgi:long-chain fatty acid transport protein